MTFLHGKALGKAVEDLVAGNNNLKLAVAYWGSGAVKTLGLSDAKSEIKVICDMLSGSCNPFEIEALITLADVKHCDGLHAKAYISDDAAIIGSCNATNNGLKEGLVEAAVLIRSGEDLRSSIDWFCTLFRSATPAALLLARCRVAWLLKNRAQGSGKTVGVIEALHARSELLQNRQIRIYAYKDANVTKKSQNRVRSSSDPTHNAKDRERYRVRNEFPCFEVCDDNWSAQGQFLICFELNTREIWSYRQVWHVRRQKPELRPGGLYMYVADRVAHADGISISRADGQVLQEAMRSYQRSTDSRKDEYWSLSEAASLLRAHLPST